MKNKPLYVLAQEHALPELEIMDKDTLEWMKSKFGKIEINLTSVTNDYEPMEIEMFKQFVPRKDWFLRNKHTNSVHGINHITREILYSLLVKNVFKLDIATEDLLITAAIHDLRRVNDNEDAGHGERAVEWFNKNKIIFDSHKYSYKDIEYAVSNHEVELSTLDLKSKEYKNQLLLGLRLADALDRYRQPKEKWWPNPDYFPVKISPDFLTFVKSFTYKTEVETLNKSFENSIEIILRNAVAAGILIDKDKYWIDKDLNFNWDSEITENQLNKNSELEMQEQTWNDYLTHKTPMGILFNKNNLFETIEKGKGLNVLHLTPNLSEIIKSKVLFTSGGGLGACVYGVPLKDNLKIHNLSKFIYETELPMFLKLQNKKLTPKALVISIPQDNFKNSKSITEINYLDWGNYYLEAFLKVGKSFLTEEVKEEIASDVDKYVFPFQDLSFLKKIDNAGFLSLFDEAVSNLQMLKVPYFETVLEFLFLFQNSNTALSYKEKGELCNSDVKELLFELNPKLKERFSLNNFNVTLEEIAEAVENKNFLNRLSKDIFCNFIKWRFSHNLRFHVMQGSLLPSNSLTFKETLKASPALVGYILFRKFRGELNLEEGLSNILFEQWRKIGAKILTYSNLPKGEIGILPFIRDALFYNGEISGDNLILGEEVEIKIIEKLIHTSKTIMRSPERKIH